MIGDSLQSLRQQGAPVLLLADLLHRHPDLPAVTYHIDNYGEPMLAISVHGSMRTGFEAWRQALGLPVGEPRSWGQDQWVRTEGRCCDVRVTLTGYGSPDEVAAVVELADAVALAVTS